MSEIPQIRTQGVNNVGNYQIGVGNIGISDLSTGTIGDLRIGQINNPNPPNWLVEPSMAISPQSPVTTQIGKPIVDMPGCVEAHTEDDGKANTLKTEDPKGVRVYCDAGTPSFNPMDYEPEQLIITRETPPPPVAPPPDPDVETPDPVTNIPKTETKEDPPCPPPNAPRIGDVAQSGTEKVSGFELQPDPNNKDLKICVTLYEDLTVVEQYLPSATVVSTTAGIAVVATTGALLAKPLADILLRIVKPAVKKLMTKIQVMMGKTPQKPSRSEIQADQYRLKKGLPPLKMMKKNLKKKARQ